MKKLVFSLLTLSLVVSCKKETATETTDNTDSLATTEVVADSTSGAKLVAEISPDSVGELLNTKNDTVYVTNFFATWCGPCVEELPLFKQKSEEMKDKPARFTFISLDSPQDMERVLSDFVKEHGIEEKTLWLDGRKLNTEFFKKHFKDWDGSFIPFTIIKKGDDAQEIVGSLDKKRLDSTMTIFIK